jgi:hypothetical protein
MVISSSEMIERSTASISARMSRTCCIQVSGGLLVEKTSHIIPWEPSCRRLELDLGVEGKPSRLCKSRMLRQLRYRRLKQARIIVNIDVVIAITGSDRTTGTVALQTNHMDYKEQARENCI